MPEQTKFLPPPTMRTNLPQIMLSEKSGSLLKYYGGHVSFGKITCFSARCYVINQPYKTGS